MKWKFFKIPKRCPYCAHKVNAQGQCKNPECIIGYVPDKPKKKEEESV